MLNFKRYRPDHAPADLWTLPVEGPTLVRDFVADRLAFARTHSEWYRRKKKTVQIFSKALRLAAIGLLAVGGVVPLMAQVDIPIAPNAGYILLAIGGSCLLADRIFGVSAAWARYMVAAIDIETLSETFRASVVATESSAGEDRRLAIMQLCKSFTDDICAIVSSETKVWVQEFDNARDELGRMAKSDGK
ncbi:SLATT domain-containing protein [Labrys sp. KNU-23]|uniref:SLATT domain-containing protein n=1 Tax=Labrys sp. KNU-23 TaxID=2789216 RepID=UPI00165A3D6B|nr:SLATT domain-containing protein [Labrys sp. KNU-23]